MHPDLEKLVVLQGVDLELKRLREQVDAIPRHIAALAARSAAAQAALLGAQESLAREEKLRRSLESDSKDQNQRAARAKRQMDVVTTTTQATALEHEIAFAGSEVRRLEDAELESMERTEALEPRLSRAKMEFEAAEKRSNRNAFEPPTSSNKGSSRSVTSVWNALPCGRPSEKQHWPPMIESPKRKAQVSPRASTKSVPPARCSYARKSGTTSATAATTRP